MLKRLLAFALCLAMVFTLGACGGSGSGDKDDTDKSGIGSTYVAIDLPDYKPTADKIIELSEGDGSGYFNPADLGAYAINETLKEVYNVEIECIRTSHQMFSTKAAQLVLSNQAPDIMQYRPQDHYSFISNGLVQPVDDLLPYTYEGLGQFKDINEQYRYKDGKLYNFIRTYRNEGVCYYWLEDLAELGLETPRELYAKGEWTWSKFLDYAKQLTLKASDGSISRYGATVDFDFHAITGESIVKYENGGYANNLRSPKLAEYFEDVLTATFEDKILEKPSDIITSFNAHSVSMALHNRKMAEKHANALHKSQSIDFAPSPRWDGADKYYVPAARGSTWIAKNAPNPQGAAAYIAVCVYLMYYPSAEYEAAGDQNSIDQKGFDEADKAAYDELNDNSKWELVLMDDSGLGVNWSNGQRLEMVRGITTYNQSWAALVEKNYPLLNAAIEESK